MCVGFWILLILHGPIFWMFFIAPATLYLLERIYRTRLFKLAKYGNIYITEVNVLPSKVSRLRVRLLYILLMKTIAGSCVGCRASAVELEGSIGSSSRRLKTYLFKAP